MNARCLYKSLVIATGLFMAGAGTVAAQPQPGECASGFCGTPKNNGGGGCGCGGGSILVNNTDIGETYSKTDDYDADGIADDFDNCPFLANRDQSDQDGDRFGDACDNCRMVANPDQHDVNVNGMGDVCDADIDGDTKLNATDNCPFVPNVNQTDTNTNGAGDACDPDMDGDGVVNRVDNCPLIHNPDQLKNAPGQFGAACDADDDKDGVENTKDNCQAQYNADQVDTNANGFGDACDPDIDGDGRANNIDKCPLVKDDQRDSDFDGVGDACQTHGFCFVPSANRFAPCLNPKGVFAVAAAPRVSAKTGEKILPTLFSNRENVGIRYSWVVTAQPDGAGVVVQRPNGTVAVSEVFQYHYADSSSRPVLVATHPGTYKLTLSADLAQDDTLYPGVVHAESEVELFVEGPIVAAAGCNAGGRGATGDGLAVGAIGLLGLLVLGRRRRAA